MLDRSKQFYYIRDTERKPIVTVCLLDNGDGTWARGVAVCSPDDSPVKKYGRNVAEHRARGAQARGSGIPFGRFIQHNSPDAYPTVFWHADILGDLTRVLESTKDVEDGFVAVPEATLTDYEQTLVSRLVKEPETITAG